MKTWTHCAYNRNFKMNARVLHRWLPISPDLFSVTMPEAASQHSCLRSRHRDPPQQMETSSGMRPRWGGSFFGDRREATTLQIHSNSLHVGSQPAPFWSSSLAQPRWISLIQIESWLIFFAVSFLLGLWHDLNTYIKKNMLRTVWLIWLRADQIFDFFYPLLTEF